MLKRRSRPPATGEPNPGVWIRDLVDESIAGLLARPTRAALTVLGTVLGVAALVATLGVAKTAGSQIVGRFDALAATDVVVSTNAPPSVLPWDAEARMMRLNGVVAAGTLSTVNVKGALLRSVPVNDPLRGNEFQMAVMAASPGLYRAVRATMAAGRIPDAGHSARADRVAVLGRYSAERLGITRVDQQPAVFVGDHLYSVIGIIGAVARQPDLLSSVVIPEGTARADYQLGAPDAVQVETRIGAARLIAAQAPIALYPNDPSLLKVVAPPDPQQVRNAVKHDLNSLFLVLGGVSLLVGAIGIANVTLVSVLERVGEIGLRRALGAGRRHIAAQFLLESTVMGLMGGALGASVGILVVVAISASRSWTPVLDPWIPLAAPVLGAAIGLVSGTYPSLRAAALEPVEALRSGT
ncbi:MAG: ABC transporter permease [Acidimicrobiales bacterium]